MNARRPSISTRSMGATQTAAPSSTNGGDRSVSIPRLRVECGGAVRGSSPRTASGAAIIGDPRNDENAIISGLHSAIIQSHNRALTRSPGFRPPGDSSGGSAARHGARQVDDRGTSTSGDRRQVEVTDIPRRPSVLPTGRPFIPVEFQGAAYRIGHSMVRPSYRPNLGSGDAVGAAGAPFFGIIFDPAGEGQARPGRSARRPARPAPLRRLADILRLRRHQLPAEQASRYDGLHGALHPAPPDHSRPGGESHFASAAQFPASRHLGNSVRTGDCGRHQRITPHAQGPIGHRAARAGRLDAALVLHPREAHLQEQGLQLGDVGADIVGRVFVGMLELDRNSYLSVDPRWRPTLPDRFGNVTGHFTIADLLTFAGVVDRGPGSPRATDFISPGAPEHRGLSES